MKVNWVVILAIIFFIIRLFSSAAKKQQAASGSKDELRKKIADEVRKKRLAQVNENLRKFTAPSSKAFTEAPVSRTTKDDTDFESPYATSDDTVSQKASLTSNVVSQILNDSGVTDSGYKETSEERAAYDTQSKPTFRLLPNLTKASYRQFIIAKEVFDKPKSMQR